MNATNKAPAALGDLRQAIDGVDQELVSLLAKRLALVNQVVDIKKQHGLPAAIPERIEEVVTRTRAEAQRQGFLPDVAEKIWRLLINEMIAYEESHLK
jgi:isochorismate pyruvate lyase